MRRPQTTNPPASWLPRRDAARMAGVTMRTISRWVEEGLLNWGLGYRGPQPMPVYDPADLWRAAQSKRPARPRVGQVSDSLAERLDSSTPLWERKVEKNEGAGK